MLYFKVIKQNNELNKTGLCSVILIDQSKTNNLLAMNWEILKVQINAALIATLKNKIQTPSFIACLESRFIKLSRFINCLDFSI